MSLVSVSAPHDQPNPGVYLLRFQTGFPETIPVSTITIPGCLSLALKARTLIQSRDYIDGHTSQITELPDTDLRDTLHTAIRHYWHVRRIALDHPYDDEADLSGVTLPKTPSSPLIPL